MKKNEEKVTAAKLQKLKKKDLMNLFGGSKRIYVGNLPND